MYRVLLISYVNWDSLIEIPALLKDGGCTVDIFCIKDSWVLKNKCYDTWIPGSAHENTFVDELLAYIEKSTGKYNWILPGDDIIVRLLNERITDESLFYKIMPLTKIENRDLLGSKAGFSNLCNKYGIRTPRFMIYNDTLTPHAISEYMGYPFLMKVDKSEGGYGIFRADNETELIANLEKIPNKENMVYGYSIVLKSMGAFGVTTQRVYTRNEAIGADLAKMGKAFGVSGFGNIVYMYNELDQQHYLIEVDVRPNAWMYYVKFIGDDFSEAVRKIINGDLTLVNSDNKKKKDKVVVTLYKKDVYRCIVEKDAKALIGWLTNKNGCWKYIPLYDSKLFWACTGFIVKTFREYSTQKIKKMLGISKPAGAA